MKVHRTLRTKFALMTAALLAGLSVNASAQEKSVLRLADPQPPTHEVAVFATKYFMDTVTKEMDGQVTFQYFGNEQLGKARDLLALTVSGATDIGYVGPALVPEKMPLGEIAQIPGLFNHACDGTKAFYELATKGIIANEFKQNGVRPPLIVILQPPNALFLTRKAPSTLGTLQGLKIRSTGSAQDITIKALKAVPIRTSGPEVYEALSRGTVDGMVVSYNSVLSYGWIESTKFGTLDLSFGSFAFTFTVSEARWQSFSPKLQEVLVRVGREASLRGCEMMQKGVDETQAQLRAKGMTLVKVSPADQAAFDAAIATVATDWAATTDRRGKPGTQTLKDFRAAVAAVGGSK